MKFKNLQSLAGALIVTTMGIFMMGCGNSSNDISENETLSGNLTISGSSALLPLMEQSIETFQEKYPDIQINAQAGGSGTGITQVLNKTVDIGNSDVFAEEKLDADQAKELVDHKVVVQGFGLVVSKDLGIDSLTKEQIKGIFSGQIRNWKQVGGPDKDIFLIHRTSGSGTRATFEKTVLDGDKNLENDTLGATQDSNGAVLTAMKQNDGAISYVALAYMKTEDAKNALSIVKIDGVSPDEEHITDGSYPFWSWGHMYTNGEPNQVAGAFIEHITSEENAESIQNLGFISGDDMKVK